MKTDELLKDTALILRGDHPAWGGDKIANAEWALHKFAIYHQKEARIVAEDITKNLNAASEVSGLHPIRCEWIANRINEKLKRANENIIDNVWVYCSTCQEEYDLPEDCDQCPICSNHTLEEC